MGPPIKTGDEVRLKHGVPRTGLIRGTTGIVLELVAGDAMVLFSGKLVRLSLAHLARTKPLAKMFGREQVLKAEEH